MKLAFKIERKELIKTLILSVLVLLIPIISYIFKLREDNIWWTTFAFQLGLFSLWLLVRFGLFRSRKSTIGPNLKNFPKDQHAQITKKAKLEAQKEKVKVSNQGIYLGMAISLIYLIVALVISYA